MGNRKSLMRWLDLISVLTGLTWPRCGKQTLGDKGGSREMHEVVSSNPGGRWWRINWMRVTTNPELDHPKPMCELEKSNPRDLGALEVAQ